MSRVPVVLVTGCSAGGLGFFLCESFAQHGCKVYATARRMESMDSLTHPQISKLVLDVTNESQATEVVQTIIEREGRIDILVNNAGSLHMGPVLELPADEVERGFQANAFSVFRMCRLVFPHMASRKSGTIANIGSITGEVPTPWTGLYCAAKAAIRSFTDSLDMEGRPHNIKAILLAPASVKSNVAANASQRGLGISEESLYKEYSKSIATRMVASQEARPMPTAEFAENAVQNILKKNPPRYMLNGGFAWVFKLLKVLPRSFRLWFAWTYFSR